MKKRHPRHSFVRSLRLLFSSAEKWEVLGRNMGGTWEPLTACADGLFLKRCTSLISDYKGTNFFPYGNGLSRESSRSCPVCWFLFQKTIFTNEKSEVRQCVDRHCYIFEIWDNWDKTCSPNRETSYFSTLKYVETYISSMISYDFYFSLQHHPYTIHPP